MSTFDHLRESIALKWFDCNAFMDKTKSPEGKGFLLNLHQKTPDAPLSPFYLNFRLLRSFPRVLADSARLFGSMLRNTTVSSSVYLADIPTAITPVVAVLSQQSGLPMITPRQPKTHGSGSSIDGVYLPGYEVALFDDVITRADSKFDAIDVLERHSLRVKHVFVFVDREQGGASQLAEAGYELHAAWTIRELLGFYLSQGKITSSMCDEISDYLG